MVDQAADYKFKSKLESLHVNWQSLLRAEVEFFELFT